MDWNYSTNSSSKCRFHQVTNRNPQMWLMAQMEACDTPIKKYNSLGLPGRADGRVGVVHQDEVGPGLSWDFWVDFVIHQDKYFGKNLRPTLPWSLFLNTRGERKNIVWNVNRRFWLSAGKKTLRHHKLFWWGCVSGAMRYLRALKTFSSQVSRKVSDRKRLSVL